MATVVTNIGSNTSIDTETPTTCSGSSSPYTVQFGTDPTGVSIGDIAVINDSTMGAEFTFLVTNISGSAYTLTYMSDDSGMGDTSPCDMYNEMFGQASATFKRAYSTISAWDSGLDNSDIYSSGDTAQGEMYDDSDFLNSSAITITGGGTVDLNHRTLTAAVGQRHDGTANTGVRLLRNADSDSNFLRIDSSVGSTSSEGNQIEWLELDANEKNVRAIVSLGTYCGAQNNLVHGGRWSGGNQVTNGISSGAKQNWICNNIVYDLYLDNGSSNAAGIYGIYQSHIDWVACVNNTVYNVRSNSSESADACVGIWVRDGWYDPMVCNNICLDTTADNGDSPDFGVEYSTIPYVHVVSNYSSDDTATGGDYQHNQSAANTFVSVDSGTEDFHLKDGSNALRAGKDMGSHEASFHSRRMPYNPYDWDVDINGRDRDSEGDDWDIGAHQCESCSEDAAATGNPAFMLFFD